jgi:transposase
VYVRAVVRLEHERDVEVLRQAALLLERENQRLVDKILQLTRELMSLKGGDPEQLRLRIAELEQQLARGRQKVFGKSSERRGRTGGEPPAESESQSQTGHGPREQPNLSHIEREFDLDDADKVCTACGGALQEWAGQYEDSEVVDVVRRQFVLVKEKRKKYRCRCGACIETAIGAPKLFRGARYTIDFAIEVAVQKYLYHLPLARQVRQMRNEGLEVDTQTLWDQINRLAAVCYPAYDRIFEFVRNHAVVFADETTWKLLGKPASGANKTWQVWTLACDSAVYYRIQNSRSTNAARNVLNGYAGVVMCDGLKQYQAVARTQPSIVIAHCWAHVRREFKAIESFFPQETEQILNLIDELFLIDRTCPVTDAPEAVELRARLRHERSRPVVARIREWAVSVRTMPGSALASAINYMTGVWSGLTRFLDDPRIPLTNNTAERANRGPVLGRKNHYGSRSKRGTEVAAQLYT